MIDHIPTLTVKTLTSFDGTLEPFLRVHQVSTVAIRQESTTPAASTKKTPAKLWMSKALPLFRVPTGEYRSHGLSRGHHFSFKMSMSPFCWSSKILDTDKYLDDSLVSGTPLHLCYNIHPGIQTMKNPYHHISGQNSFKKNLTGSVMVWISDTVMVMTIDFLEALDFLIKHIS